MLHAQNERSYNLWDVGTLLASDIKDADLIVFCVLTVPADITKMTINLKAPIIVNADTLKGVQLIADNNDYEVRYPIYSILEERKGE